jgi:hypothetical protein
MKEFIPSKSSIYTIFQARSSRLSCRATGSVNNLEFRIKQDATNETPQFYFLVCVTHTVCCNFHSKNGDLSYFVQFGVLADHVHRARERGSVLRVCSSPAPFCNLQSQRKRGRTFLLICSNPYGARFQRKTKAESLLPGRIFRPP